MDASEKADLSRIKVRLATLENALKRKISKCLCCLPDEDRHKYNISPSLSMNSTYDPISSTPKSASGVVRGAGRSVSSISALSDAEGRDIVYEINQSIASQPNRRAEASMINPYIIWADMRVLLETFKSYNKVFDTLMDKLLHDEEALEHLRRKGDHFTSILEDLTDDVELRVWNLCKVQQSPLPSDRPEELQPHFQKFTSGVNLLPGYIPPLQNYSPPPMPVTVRTNSASVQSLGSGVEADLHWHQQQQLPLQNLPGVNPQSEAPRNAMGALKDDKKKVDDKKEGEGEDYIEVMNDPAFLQSVLQNVEMVVAPTITLKNFQVQLHGVHRNQEAPASSPPEARDNGDRGEGAGGAAQ